MSKQRVLLRFQHGLGDAAQLTSVFRHLKKYKPNWELYLWAKRGKHSVGNGYCQRVWHDQEDPPDYGFFHRVEELYWYENYNHYPDRPNTKVTNCLEEVFHIPWDASLSKYQIHLSDDALRACGHYLESIGCIKQTKYNAVCIHYQGNTSSAKKDVNQNVIALLCEYLICNGYVPVILDWDGRSGLADQKRVFSPGVHSHDLWGGFGSGDAERLTALITQSSLFVGIDSGPQKCAGATTTPSIGLWTGHHPVQFMDLCDNFIHLVPDHHRDLPPCLGHPEVVRYFEEHYEYETYLPGISKLTNKLIDTVQKTLGLKKQQELISLLGFWCRTDNTEQDFVVINDIYVRDAYKTCLLPRRRPELVVDIGAHIGTFAKKWHELNPEATIICVEACPENIKALQANVGGFATVIHAACTYQKGELGLLNAVRPNCESTGGSMIVPLDQLDSPLEQSKLKIQAGYQYWHDRRPMPKITLEEIMERAGYDHIDVLKLDCEGSEYSILGDTPSLARIAFILGEYHDEERWDNFRASRLAGWDYGHMSRDTLGRGGNFHYRNPFFNPYDDGTGNKNNILRVAIPAGIGDATWILMKMAAMLKDWDYDKVHITLCGAPPHRSKTFVERFPLVSGADYSDLSTIEADYTTPEGTFNWAPSQPNWHNRFDWMLQANRHLELGKRLEEWFPQYDTDWNIAERIAFTEEELNYASRLKERLGDFVAFYMGPIHGNTIYGYNRDELWKREDWGKIAHLFAAAGLKIIIVGADWDRSYYETVAPYLGDHEEYLGKLAIWHSYAVIKQAKCLIAYQSGIGIFATYMGVPTAQFWRPETNSLDPHRFVAFSEKMASAWVPPDALANQRYLPCIYTKCSPESIYTFAADHWLS